MKAPIVIAKNLKLLFRSKESLFTIIFGPLIIILLVSAAYTGGDEKQTIRVGTVAQEYTPLADNIVTALNKNGYLVSTFTNESECLDKVRTGTLNTCILFPENFSIRQNETAVVTFAVDYSRVNLVYNIIDGLATEFNIQRTEITQDFVATALQHIATAQQEVHARIADADALDQEMTGVQNQIGESRSSLEHVDINISFTDLQLAKGGVTGLAAIATDLRIQGDAALQDAITALEDARGSVDNQTRDSIDDAVRQLENESQQLRTRATDTTAAGQEADNAIDDATTSVQQVRERFGQLVNASTSPASMQVLRHLSISVSATSA